MIFRTQAELHTLAILISSLATVHLCITLKYLLSV